MFNPNKVSLLNSQVGYAPENTKTAVFRSLSEHPEPCPTDYAFQLLDINGVECFHSFPVYWGEKWGSHWWTADYSEWREEGVYSLKWHELQTNHFKIANKVLMNEQMTLIALDQLDERYDGGDPSTSTVNFPGVYTVPGAAIWRDCGSHLAEIGAVGITVHGLIDLVDNQWDHFSSVDQKRIIDHIMIGAKYICDSQESTADPMTNGRFRHTVLNNAREGEMEAHKEVYIWHDIAFAITVLTRAYRAVKAYDQEKADLFLTIAKKAWDLAVLRPYYLSSELDFVATERNPLGDIHASIRMLYNIKDQDFTFPTSLRTREKLPFLWGCTLLYELTHELKYLDTAIEWADQIASRQCTDWSHPIEETYGNFYEFEGRDDAFLLEMAQHAQVHMGNDDPTNVRGFMELVRLLPDHPKTAAWYNVVRTYGEFYVKKAVQLNPFNLYPVSVYSDPEHGGVKFFQNIVHGATCLYGQIARNILEIGSFLQDNSYHNIAHNNVQYVVGLNPGMPDAYEESSWDSQSLIVGVGSKWFSHSHTVSTIPKGSVISGFSAAPQFWHPRWESWIADYPDKPSGIFNPEGKYQFNEDWIAHSHAYVSGVSMLEADFILEMHITDRGAPVQADVEVAFSNKAYTLIMNESGTGQVRLPANQSGTIKVVWNGRTYTKHIETMGGGYSAWQIDVSAQNSLKLTSPGVLKFAEAGEAQLSVSNIGYELCRVSVMLSGSGVELDCTELALNIEVGQTVERSFKLIAGTRIMPYLIYVQAQTDYSRTICVTGGFVGE